MAERVPARLTAAGGRALSAAEGRRFGLTVGGAFVVLASVLWWRGMPTAAAVLGSLGAALALAGLALPTHLGPVERAWMALAHAISKVTTPVVMGVMYLGVLLPAGLLRRNLGRNPLVHDAHENSYWQARPQGRRRSSSMQRQF